MTITENRKISEKIRKTIELIDLEKKRLELLVELKKSLMEENAKVIIHNIISDKTLIFIAIDRESGKQFFNGTYKKMLNYLGQREYTEIFWRPLTKK